MAVKKSFTIKSVELILEAKADSKVGAGELMVRVPVMLCPCTIFAVKSKARVNKSSHLPKWSD